MPWKRRVAEARYNSHHRACDQQVRCDLILGHAGVCVLRERRQKARRVTDKNRKLRNK